MSVRFEMRLTDDLARRVDEVRGPASRAAWVRWAIEQAIGALTPVPSPAGREAELEVARVQPAVRAAAPQRAAGSRSSVELPAGVSRGVPAFDVSTSEGRAAKRRWEEQQRVARDRAWMERRGKA